MKILKAMIELADEPGAIRICDAIEHEGEIWLVPEWLIDLAARVRRPRRIVRPLLGRLQLHSGHWSGDLTILESKLPIAVLQGRVQSEPGVAVVVELPQRIEAPIPSSSPQ